MKRVAVCVCIAMLAGLTSAAWCQATRPSGAQDEPILRPLLDDWSVDRPSFVAQDPNTATDWPAQCPADGHALPVSPAEPQSRPHDSPMGIAPVVTRIPEPACILLILGGLLALRTRH